MDPWFLIWKEKHCKNKKVREEAGAGVGDARSVGLSFIC